jgi:hypothetical protein
MVALSDGMHGLALGDKGMPFLQRRLSKLETKYSYSCETFKGMFQLLTTPSSAPELPIEESEYYTRLTYNPSTTRVQGVLFLCQV